MKKFQRVDNVAVRVQKFVPGGQALGTLSDGPEAGKKIFFWGALPGETVTAFTPTKIKSHYVEAVAENVATPAPQRVAPRDDCYLSTSPWQILDFTAELAAKRDLVRECFRQHWVDLPDTLAVATDGRDYFYRNKMEYSLYFDHDSQQILPAFHRRGSHQKVPVHQSSLERPEIWERAQTIFAELNARGEEARTYQSLMLRANQAGQVAGGLFVNHQPHPEFPQLSDTLLGRTYTYSPNGFFQINLPVYEMALRAMQKYVTTPKVLDLFSGVGTIGLSIARDAMLTLVECDKAAFAELEKNVATALGQAEAMSAQAKGVAPAQAKGAVLGQAEVAAPRQAEAIKSRKTELATSGQAKAAASPRLRAVLAKSETVLDYIQPDTTVILDPPRAGCAPELVARLAEVAPPQIIYLSCNPATQARDVAGLLASGHFTLLAAQAFNFFPHTPHIENLVVLARK